MEPSFLPAGAVTALPLPTAQWSYQVILVRLALALALGLLLGLERERRGKEAGLRTFGFLSLLGALGGSLGDGFALLALVLTGLLAVLLNVHSLRSGEGVELTTSAAMFVTSMAGVLCGMGHTITPASVMVISTALLAWKERLAGFSMGLTEGELRSALLLAILAIVIYPALPVGAVGPWKIVEPRAAWITVILIASIGFVNYILWKLYGARGIELSGLFGGLVNSNFTVIEMTTRVRESQGRFAPVAYRGIVVALCAMLGRNATLLLILAPLALLASVGAFALMLAAGAMMAVFAHLRASTADAHETTDLKLTLPFSLQVALKYGALFLLLHMVGILMQRQFGEAGFYLVTVVGGLLSSASAVAAAASMASQGEISPLVAGHGAVIASLTSLAFSFSFVLRSGDRPLVRRLMLSMLAIAAAGGLGMLLASVLRALLGPWIEALSAL
ncbi:MAG: MgtC/SapB family protein [Rubrivivax sp.]|nr:MgtC/SapB family protein [Rubrivivax sp.]